MRREDPVRVTALRGRLLLLGVCLPAVLAVAAGAIAADDAPRLTGPETFTEPADIPPLAQPVTDDERKMRAFPEQPPVIPHSIEGYQLTLTANRCLSCHRRQYVEGSGAPMISITHYVDRHGQTLADVSPRRYFCLQCHVQQTKTQPLVENTFVDMLRSGPEGR